VATAAARLRAAIVDLRVGAADFTARLPAADPMAAHHMAADHMAVAVRTAAATGKFLKSLSYTASWCIEVASGSQLFLLSLFAICRSGQTAIAENRIARAGSPPNWRLHGALGFVLQS